MSTVTTVTTPWADALTLIEDIIDGGMSEATAIERTAQFLDEGFKADLILPAPYGGVVEALDGEAIELMLGLLWKWARDAPERKERRAERQENRAERRAARKAKRQGQ